MTNTPGNHESLAHGIDRALTENPAKKRRRPWLDNSNTNGNAAFAHDPNDHLANGLQAQFEEYQKHTGQE